MLANTHPELNTTLIEPLKFLEQHFLAQRQAIEDWFQAQWQLTTPPIYGSVDLRNAGYKLAPIDMNLFPAGFNNLNPDHMTLSIEAARNIIIKTLPQAKNILVLPEQHTRNRFYWENVNSLKSILEQAGFAVRLGILDGDTRETQKIELSSGQVVTVEPLTREGQILRVEDFKPDFILLNNDLSEGIPEILQNLNQRVIPPAELGWSQRLKSDHFQYYAQVANEFSAFLPI